MESGQASAGAGEKMQTEEQQQEKAAMTVAKKMKVMVAIDESDESSYALKWVLLYLIGLEGGPASTTPQSNQEEPAMVYLVHVQQPFQNFIYPAGPVRKAQEENSAVLLSRALQMCKDKMVKAETLILVGDPKDMICQVAEQMHVDLLVVGSRGLGKIKSLGETLDVIRPHLGLLIIAESLCQDFMCGSLSSSEIEYYTCEKWKTRKTDNRTNTQQLQQKSAEIRPVIDYAEKL